MEPESRYTFVGAVVLALIAIVVVGYAWLVGIGSADNFRYYEIHFEKQSLEGLQIGSDVNMRGVKVGRVQQYSISAENINRVDVVVRVDRETPVSVNTRAVVGRNLLTGIARIDLQTPGTPGPELAEVPPGERYPVIPEGTSDIAQIAGAMSRLAVSGEAALGNVQALLDEKNREQLIGAVVAVRQLAEGIDARLARVDQAIDGVVQTASSIRDASRRVSDSLASFTSQGTDLVRQLGPFVQQGKTALEAVTRSAHALENATGQLSQRLGSAADSGTRELQATARELRRGAEQLSRAADRLRDPRSALLGPSPQQLGPGEHLP
ncbi:MAG: MlaD family protein [Burkholderiaceae bacterium]|nr:MlaD family protein [Burkholderiaceae bacterium]